MIEVIPFLILGLLIVFIGSISYAWHIYWKNQMRKTDWAIFQTKLKIQRDLHALRQYHFSKLQGCLCCDLCYEFGSYFGTEQEVKKHIDETHLSLKVKQN